MYACLKFSRIAFFKKINKIHKVGVGQKIRTDTTWKDTIMSIGK